MYFIITRQGKEEIVKRAVDEPFDYRSWETVWHVLQVAGQDTCL